jgi:hypothetical protein
MAKLTSRQTSTVPVINDYSILKACTPSINLLNWVSGRMLLPDDSQKTISGTHLLIEEALDCMVLTDYVVMSAPSVSILELYYDVALQPFDFGPYLSVKVKFRVRP